MKNLPITTRFQKTSFLFGLLVTISIIVTSFRTTSLWKTNSIESAGNISMVFPDSIYEDSTEIYDITDTAYTYSDGGDSIYVIADSLLTDATCRRISLRIK